MSPLLLTILIAFFIVASAIALLAIGWLITGKSKMTPGACGRAPTAKKNDSCGDETSCSLCDKNKK